MVEETRGMAERLSLCVRVRVCVCVHIQMVNCGLWYYCFSLSVTHRARLTEPYPLPAHMPSLPFLTWKYAQSQLGATESFQRDGSHPSEQTKHSIRVCFSAAHAQADKRRVFDSHQFRPTRGCKKDSFQQLLHPVLHKYIC